MAKHVNFSGPALSDRAIRYAQELHEYLRKSGLNDGQIDDINQAVDTIRYASFVAGRWNHAPIDAVVRFDKIGSL